MNPYLQARIALLIIRMLKALIVHTSRTDLLQSATEMEDELKERIDTGNLTQSGGALR